MTGFNDVKFSTLFGRIHMALNPGLRNHGWETDSVTWTRDRHSRHTPHYACQGETFVLTSSMPKRAWAFLFVSETWWDMDGKNVLRNNSWGKMLKGNKADVMAWMKRQEELLNRKKAS